MMKSNFYLIDAMAFAFRAFHAINANLTDTKNRPTNAVYGFTRILLKVLREHDPEYLAVVFDAPGKNFRDEIYPEYKASRVKTPPELLEQFPRMHAVVKALNLPLLCVPGVEADDVIGTLARAASSAGKEVVIVSSDKDLLQLVDARVRVFDPVKSEEKAWWGPEQVRARFGVGPEHVCDALALIGDSADNIPGVTLIGEVKAAKLLTQYQNLENLYANLNDIKGKQREYLEMDRDKAFFARELVTIKTDVAVATDLETYTRRPWNKEELTACFNELAFHSLLQELEPDKPVLEIKQEYHLVNTPAKLQELMAALQGIEILAVDTETTHIQPMLAELVGISLCAQTGVAYYVPVKHTVADLEALMQEQQEPSVTLSSGEVLAALKPILENPDIGKIGQNIKYDILVLRHAGITLRGVRMDTMIASYLTDPSRLRHNLDELSLLYLNYKMTPISDLIGKGAQAVTFDQVPIEQAKDYSCEDADMSFRLARFFQPKISEFGLDALLNDIELPLIHVLANMEWEGIKIDVKQFEALQRELTISLKKLESEIHELAGEPFNINSPKQLQVVLYDKIGLRPVRKNKSGFSTDVDTLEALAGLHPLPNAILEYRSLEKLRGTYVEALPKLVHPRTGRIHTSFNQAVAATGRLSSSNPNLQNIPARTDLGRRIREGFVASSPDQRLIAADYSQIELRVLAHLSGDKALCAAFESDADIHRETAARIFSVSPEKVTSEMRRQAKAVNFGVIYGMGDFSLARNVGLTREEAKQFITQYFDTYPGVARWLESIKEQTRREGYITTLMNRRRYIPDINSDKAVARNAAERVAVNTPVQGSAADIIKVAMVKLDAALALKGYCARLVLQVHDELLIESDKECADKVSELMKSIMENAAALRVPLKVDVGVGVNWAEIH
jgi:DNA polymerase I